MKMNKEVVMVRISDIIPNRFQPRLTFDEEALNELANSIKEHGIIQPLILRDLGSKYEIIAGERRYKASQIAGLTEVPAIVGSMDDQTSAELALIENIQRKDLSAIEEAKSYKIILDMGSFTQDQLAKRMGKSQSTIANKMRLLSLTNEVQMALMNNLISERHARCLLQVKDADKQKELLNKIITERMNVRDADAYIKNMLGITVEDIREVEAPIISNNFELPKLDIYNDKKISELSTIPVELPKPDDTQNNKNLEMPKIDISPVEIPKIGIPNMEVKEENPNVYSQSNNTDFINILNLDKEDNVPNPVKSALSGLNVVSTESEVFNGNDLSVEENHTPSIQNIEIPAVENKNNDMSKMKLATAIRLAKDSVEEIKKAGYNAVVEEVDGTNDYQIIIKVQK